MLALETTDDWGWTVTVTVAPYGSDTYTNAQPSAKFIVGFVTWLLDGGRPWVGHGIFSWAWVRNTNAADVTQSGVKLTLKCNVAFSLDTADSRFTETTGMNPDDVVTQLDPVASARGTWAPRSRIASRNNARLLDKGDCGGGNLVRPGVPGRAAYNPAVAAIGTVADAQRLTDILSAASNPRRIWVYQVHTDSWLDLALGGVQRSPVDYQHYNFTLTTAGETL